MTSTSAKELARSSCEKLLELARNALDEDSTLSKRYVSLARRIAERHRVHLGNRVFCKKCGVVWVQGKTLRVRLSPREKTVLYICVHCNKVRRIPYSRSRKCKRLEKR